LLATSGHNRATAADNAVTKSFVSEYVTDAPPPSQLMP
jgi:hypothetical protein